MSETNLNYKPKTYQNIFNTMLNDLIKQGLLTKTEAEEYIKKKGDLSNYIIIDKSIDANVMSDYYTELTHVYNSRNINEAVGDDLDNLGLLVGLKRNPASKATVEVIFTLNDSHSEIILSSGLIISGKRGVEYRTLQDLVLPAGVSSVSLPCEAVLPGPDGRVNENELSILVSKTPYKFLINNPTASVGGYPRQDDESFRNYIKDWQSNNQRGSLGAFKHYLDNKSGVGAYKLIPLL